MKGNETVMEQQSKIQALNVTPELLNVLLEEFNRAALVEGEDRQLRKPAEGLFRYTVLQMPEKIPAVSDTSKRLELFAVPIHRVGQYKG